MADKRIDELPDGLAISNDTLFAAEQQGRAVRISGKQFRDLVGDSSGTGTGTGSGVTSFNGRDGIVKPQKGDYTPDMIGAVPTSRTINGKPLTNNITLTAADLGISGGTGGDYTGGGYVEMTTSIPVSERKPNTLYGLILKTYS